MGYYQNYTTSAALEALNGKLQLAKRNARGYRNFENFKAIAAGGVFVFSPLPATDFNMTNISNLSGDVTFILQSKMHNLYINDYMDHFPDSKFLFASKEYEKRSRYDSFSSCPPLLEEFHLEHYFYAQLPTLFQKEPILLSIGMISSPHLIAESIR